MSEIPGDRLDRFLSSDVEDVALFLEMFESFSPSSPEKAFDWADGDTASRFWKRTYEMVSSHSFQLLSPGDDDLDSFADSSASQSQNIDLSRRIILSVVQLAMIGCSSKTCQTENHFLNTIILLYSLFPNMKQNQEKVKLAILELCEHAWKRMLPRREEMAANTVQCLLTISLQQGAPKNRVGRVWELRECLPLVLQPQNPHCDIVVAKLHLCFKSKLYLEVRKGMKFLSWVLQQQVVSLNQIQRLLKEQLLTCTPKHAEAYGTILYNAWAHGNVLFRRKVEEDCLGDIINLAIYFNRKTNNPAFQKLCKFLNCFHEKRSAVDMATMLLRLYDPIIWRSLKVANNVVRGNAAHLLFDVYPLTSPNNKVEQEMSLTRQYNEMVNLLSDSSPEVRCVAALGLFNCLRIGWENIPAEVIRKWLEVLLGPCLHDANSSQLRYTVIKGLMCILENPLCHETLRALLPTLQDSFHDTSEKVREAFCCFLKKINSVEGFKYWEVVPVEHLLARLEEDSPGVCDLIVDLTCKNLLPDTQSERRMLERSLFLFKTNVQASRIYVRHWCLQTSLEVVVSFMKLWNKTVLGYVLEKSKVNESYVSNGDTSVSSGTSGPGGEGSPLDDPVILCGVLDALCMSWKSVSPRLLLPENKQPSKELLIALEESMPKFILFFRDGPAFIWNPLVLLASSLQLDSLKPHLSLSMSRLRQLKEDSSETDFSPLVGGLVYQGSGDQLLELLADWTGRGLLPGSASGRRSSARPLTEVRQQTKRVCFDERPAKPGLALRVLHFLLEYPELHSRLLARNRDYLTEEILPVLCSVKDLTGECCSGATELPFSRDVALLSFNLLCHLSVLLHQQEGSQSFDAVRYMERLMIWMNEALVPSLGLQAQTRPGQDPPENSEETSARPQSKRKAARRRVAGRKHQLEDEGDPSALAADLVKEFLECASDMILLGLHDSDFLMALSSSICCLLKSGKGSEFLSLSCSCLHRLVQQTVLREVEPSEPSVSLLSTLASSVIRRIGWDYANCSREMADQSLASCSRPLGQSLQQLFKEFSSSRLLLVELLAMLLASVMGNTSNAISKMELREVSQLAEAPPLTSLILERLIGKEQSGLLVSAISSFLEDVRQPLQILALVCCLSYMLAKIGKQCLLEKDFTQVVHGAETVLLRIAHTVKDRHENEENMHQIPDVVYCRWSLKLLKEIKQEISPH